MRVLQPVCPYAPLRQATSPTGSTPFTDSSQKARVNLERGLN